MHYNTTVILQSADHMTSAVISAALVTQRLTRRYKPSSALPRPSVRAVGHVTQLQSIVTCTDELKTAIEYANIIYCRGVCREDIAATLRLYSETYSDSQQPASPISRRVLFPLRLAKIFSLNIVLIATNGNMRSSDRDTSAEIYNKKQVLVFYKNLKRIYLFCSHASVQRRAGGRRALSSSAYPCGASGHAFRAEKMNFKLSLGLLAKPGLCWLRWGHRDRLPETGTVPPKPGHLVTKRSMFSRPEDRAQGERVKWYTSRRGRTEIIRAAVLAPPPPREHTCTAPPMWFG
ncbi:hypothetical protein EVAR_13201_1 [Eumeta japonica]|uniref:Uncharacterized protein n=1 Tax=Eumeta variegata TaxID=151549 RepID=A0A4C1TSL4_EUMVA|nr:hypothetical protein EVAR_13201_1 [Eumeta japonica]